MTEYEELDATFKKMLMDTMRERAPFWSLLGMELADARKGWATVRLPFAEKLLQPLGVAHGGAIFSAADSAVAMALLGLVERDEVITTVEMKINYLMPFSGGEITAEAVIVHKGGRTALGDVTVRNGQGAMIAKAVATYMIIRNDKAPRW